MVYRLLAEEPADIYSLLLVAGYLKTSKKELQADDAYLCEVSIMIKNLPENSEMYNRRITYHCTSVYFQDMLYVIKALFICHGIF